MTTSDTKHGIILFAHGSRDPLWHKPIEAVAAHIAITAPHTTVECAYLELSTPDLATVTQRMVDAGLRAITIVPMFLGVGRHAREDLPLLVQALGQQHPTLQITLKAAVGEDQRLVEMLAHIALDGTTL
jgi:sirohydrochlorin cobaltochelatase